MELQNVGTIILKDRVKELVKMDIDFLFEIQGLVHRFEHKDLGGVIELKSDPNYNVSGNDAIIIGKYISSEGIIWIVSEKNVNKTAVMFPGYYDGADEECQ